MRKQVSAVVAGLAAAAAAAAQPASVVGGPHNLSAGGPGTIRAASEGEVCIFCHAPHGSAPIRPLWNRAMPTEAYTIYRSRALDASLGQPTGSSKMCLSCHDGTIALGAVVSRTGEITMSGGARTMPAGRSRLGTDLSDDHPVSFKYEPSLATKDAHLRSPTSLPAAVRLDANGELQCTTCHDAHDNSNGAFLVMQHDGSRLCVTCHSMGTTTVTGHGSCSDCHQPHTAPSGPYLLKRGTVTATCVSCHDGSVSGAPDIRAELNKAHAHDTGSPMDPPDPAREHATCTSCHDPHTMGRGGASPGSLHPNFGRIAGVSASGAAVAVASSEAEVCFVCHAEGSVPRPVVSRQVAQTNTRLEFAPGAASFHPVLSPGKNPDVPSLKPGWSEASLVQCSDCHASDGGAVRGPHGSMQAGLLRARYETMDPSTETESAYALCYQCHDRANILEDRSFRGHRRHIVDLRTPCATCHDAHGIASAQGSEATHSRLMNFATSTVGPDPSTGRMEYRQLGTRAGECYLSCHGVAHSPKGY